MEPIDKLERTEWNTKVHPDSYIYNLILMQQVKINQLVDAVNQLRSIVDPDGEGLVRGGGDELIDSMKSVWLLTTGDGSDGNEWNVHSIHATEEGSKAARAKYQHTRTQSDGSLYVNDASVEEWDVAR